MTQISDLFSGDPPDDDELQEAFQNFMSSPLVQDTIFGSFGPPPGDVSTGGMSPVTRLILGLQGTQPAGVYNRISEDITLSERFFGGLLEDKGQDRFEDASSRVLSHEMAHAVFDNPDDEFQGLINMMGDKIDPRIDFLDTEKTENFAEAMTEGFDLARRHHDRQDRDKSTVSSVVKSVDEEIPGTLEAFNFFIRSGLGK